MDVPVDTFSALRASFLAQVATNAAAIEHFKTHAATLPERPAEFIRAMMGADEETSTPAVLLRVAKSYRELADVMEAFREGAIRASARKDL